MITVGAFEAKTHLSSLLEQVAAGEDVLITKHGKPIARLVGEGAPNHEALLAKLKAARVGISVTHEEIREWINEGRR